MKRLTSRYIPFFALAFLLGAAPLQARESAQADRVYALASPSIYQIRVIDIASDKKSSIGSGFQFTAEGLIATNYHVVSDYVLHPGANRIEYFQEDTGTGPLELVTADVVRDLAILRRTEKNGGSQHLSLGESKLPKGTKIFSLGNPHDLGMTITEGPYNGLSDSTHYEKIHFSGSINPGMSGGPAVDSDGTVVGINVMTAGNQISFLLPVEYLKGLYAEYEKNPGQEFVAHAHEIIQEQLLRNQESYMTELLESEWPQTAFGPAQVPGQISQEFKCWGRSNTDEEDSDDDNYTHFVSTCSSQDSIYISEDFTTGLIAYRYDSLSVPQDVPLPRFYALYRDNYSFPLDINDNAQKNDVTNFACDSRFVKMAGKKWHSAFCVRQYKKFPRLYDVQQYAVLVGEGRTGLKISLAAQGVSQESARRLSLKFMQSIALAAPLPPPSQAKM